VVNAVDLPESLSDIRAQLRTTLNDAVTKHGFDLAPEAGACSDRECLRVAAVNSGASDVLVATGGRNDMRGYHVELRIWNVASDREDHAVAECNVCAALQMVESVKGVASNLLDRVPTLHANLAVAPTPVVPMGPPMIARAQPVAARDSRTRRIVGWSLIGAGVASGVASGILFAMNGHHGDCLSGVMDSCAQERHTLVPASITAGVAVAAVVAGIVVVHGANQDLQTVTIAASPFGLSIGGRL
jgi:hypothetical protein